jgi:hypothetical protein
MVVEAVRHAWVNSLKSTFRGLRERLATMEGLASRESTGVRAAKNAAMSLIKVIGIFVLLLLSICVLGGILGSAVDLISPHNVAVIACLTITGVCLFVGFRLHTHRRRFWFRNYKEFRRICLKYDFVFDQFVRVAILEDHQAWLEAMPVQHTTDFWGPTPIQIETADNDDGIRP